MSTLERAIEIATEAPRGAKQKYYESHRGCCCSYI